eukprot:508953-Amorphochlora_amoeboformis.AAC.1
MAHNLRSFELRTLELGLGLRLSVRRVRVEVKCENPRTRVRVEVKRENPRTRVNPNPSSRVLTPTSTLTLVLGFSHLPQP